MHFATNSAVGYFIPRPDYLLGHGISREVKSRLKVLRNFRHRYSSATSRSQRRRAEFRLKAPSSALTVDTNDDAASVTLICASTS